MRELGVVADLENTGLRFRGQGRAGEGQLEADGPLTWRGGESKGELRVRGQNLLVADLPEYRVVASPDLHFQVDGKRLDVAGNVKIPSARVQPAQLTGAVKASDDARYVGEHPAERAGTFVVHSEVRIDMGDDVRVDAFGLQGRIVGGVGTTVHTAETPIGRGELSVDEGRYEAYGQKLEINRGRLLFDATPLDDPGLDIEARRRIETTEVGVNVRGTLQEPRLTFFSDPSMTQSQIMSYLLTGKSVDSITGAETKSISAASDSLALQGGGFLASQLGRRIGIEEVGVESTVNSAGEANTALVLGKFLSPRLFISYGISLTESINTLKLRYTISDKWVLKTEAGENQSADIEFATER
jgi:translocation and assembly module TamB